MPQSKDEEPQTYNQNSGYKGFDATFGLEVQGLQPQIQRKSLTADTPKSAEP